MADLITDTTGAEYFFEPSPATSDVAHWADGTDLWDRARIGDNDLPGVVKISGIKRAQKIDVKTAKGKNTTKVTLNGYDPAKFDMNIRLVTSDDKDAWDGLRETLEPSPTKERPTPYNVDHPALKMRGIGALIIESIDGPDLDEKIGVVTIILHCMEWQLDFDVQVKSTTPTGAKGDRPRTTADDRDASWDSKYHKDNPGEAGPAPPVPPSYYDTKP